MRAFFNVLGIIAATLLSFVLIAVLITAPIWQGFFRSAEKRCAGKNGDQNGFR